MEALSRAIKQMDMVNNLAVISISESKLVTIISTTSVFTFLLVLEE